MKKENHGMILKQKNKIYVVFLYILWHILPKSRNWVEKQCMKIHDCEECTYNKED